MPQIKTSVDARRGRPPGTSPRELEVIALRLFATLGYDATTVDQIATEAGVSRRTFFRYFDTKADVLWHDFDNEVAALGAAFDAADPQTPLMDAIRDVVVSVNRYRAADVPELRERIHLIATIPALQASSAPHYDAWEREVSRYAGLRLGVDPADLVPMAIGRCTLAACRAAFDEWVRRADQDLTHYLAASLTALGSGFAESPHAGGSSRS